MSVPLNVRHAVIHAFTKKRHLQLRTDAVVFVYTTLEAHELLGDAAVMTEAIEALASALVERHVSGGYTPGFDGLVVTSETLRWVYNQLLVESAGGGEEDAGAARVLSLIHI